MELFNVYNDLIFRSIPFIVRELIENESIMIDNGKDKELRSIFLEANGLGEDKNKRTVTNAEYISDVLMLNNKINGIENEYFLTKEDGQITINPSNVSVSTSLPIVFSRHEREYIRLMLEDPEARCFMDDKLVKKLYDALEGYDVSYIKNNYIERESVTRNIDEEKLRSILLVITKALLDSKKIIYSYSDAKGEIRSGIASPYKLIYSLRERVMRLAARPDNEKERFILMNIDRFVNVQLSDEYSEAFPENFYLSQKRKLILKVENDHKDKNKRKKAIERCVMVFSSYERSSKFIEDSSYFIIEIGFYRFDKDKLINDILSLGSSIEVLEVQKLDENGKDYISDPELDIRGEVIDRLKKMYAAMK